MSDPPAGHDVEAAPDALSYDALLFDLDGVITRTATVHAAAWKSLFDDFLARWALERGMTQAPFDPVQDYLTYVDGRRRQDGVVTFLASRNITLPPGLPGDDDPATVAGLGGRKDAFFLQELDRHGVEVFPDAVALLDAARAAGCHLAVVSASENCEAILRNVLGLLDRFEVRVTGIEVNAEGLAGKPAPDMFLAAAARLGVPADRAVVLEDAVAGVQAGRAGRFGLVVGVDRRDDPASLLAAGADVAVSDLTQLLRH